VLSALTLLAFVSWSGSAAAVPFDEGDVFAAVGGGRVAHYDSDGNFIEILNTTQGGFTTGMGFDSSGRLYVTNFSAGTVSRFNSDGTLDSAAFVTTGADAPGVAAPESIVFDAAGNFYVGHADGSADVVKYNSAGTFQAAFNLGTESRGSDWIDLAADQKTLVYTSEGFLVKQFDTSTNTQLADFGVLADRPAFALRLLDDGGLLVADSVNVKRLDSTGATIDTYDVAGNDNFFSLNLDPDGTSFWAGDFGTQDLFKFDIATGALLDTIDTDIDVAGSQLFGVALLGEICQAGCGPREVPEPASMAMLLLGLVGLGAYMRRWNATSHSSHRSPLLG
jgi:sugar lactone lactonase YvrE